MQARTGTTKKRAKLPVIPEAHGAIVKRADARARIHVETTKEFDAIEPVVGARLIIDAIFDDGFDVVSADVYAVHPQFRFIDVTLRAPLADDAREVVIKRSAMGALL